MGTTLQTFFATMMRTQAFLVCIRSVPMVRFEFGATFIKRYSMPEGTHNRVRSSEREPFGYEANGIDCIPVKSQTMAHFL